MDKTSKGLLVSAIDSQGADLLVWAIGSKIVLLILAWCKNDFLRCGCNQTLILKLRL